MEVKRIISFIFLAAGLAFFQFNGFAWDGAGHMVIAAEAFRQLPPELKAQAIEVLKAHPDYAKWAKAYHPNPTIDLAEYVFMRSSTWPDEIRGTGNEYDHPEWHFIDYPLRPPSFPFEPDVRPTNNVLFGIGQCETTLGDTNANPELRAVYLSYLVHLIGDLHQPLHCASLFTAVYPDGDRGGNDFYVKPEDVGVRLHGIWDGLLGTSLNPRTEWDYSLKLAAAHPRNSLPKLAKDTTPREWSLESRELAIQDAYLNGTLKGGTNSEAAPPLPAGYLKTATVVAELQGALAGIRLADEIQKYLKLGRVVPLLPPNTNTVARHLPAAIGTAQAGDYYDEDMVVTGKVVQVSIGSKVALLNLDKPFPDSPFTVVIFKEHLGRFGDLQNLKNHNVTATGTITQYHDKPEMILETAGQLKMDAQE